MKSYKYYGQERLVKLAALMAAMSYVFGTLDRRARRLCSTGTPVFSNPQYHQRDNRSVPTSA